MELYEQVDRRVDVQQARDCTRLGKLWIPVPRPIPLRHLIRGALLNALAYTGGVQVDAARLLGLTVRTMSVQCINYDVPDPRGNRRRAAKAQPQLVSLPSEFVSAGGRAQRTTQRRYSAAHRAHALHRPTES